MAKRRLNKKVALIGTAIFVVVALGTILAILYLSRDPEKFITEGDAAWQAKDYERAEHCYHKARHLAKTNSLRIEVLFKLVDMYIESGQWRFARGCWEEIVNIDNKNIKARYARLKYAYIMADSGFRRAWQDVREQASELIKIVEQAGLLADNTAKWETRGLQIEQAAGQQMGLYLYLLKGRAALEMAKYGMVTNPEEFLTQAVADLEKSLQLDPSNVDSFWYLSQAAIVRGDLFATRGNIEERDKATAQAKGFAEQAVKVASGDPRAHMNLLTVKLMDAQKGGKEQIASLEQEYLSLVNKFPSSAEVFARLSRFYSDSGVSSVNIDKAIKAIEQAMELDKNNVIYAMQAANLCYRKFSYYGQRADLNKAIEITKRALTLPGAQEENGPQSWANRVNRLTLYVFLANYYIEQVLEPPAGATDAETAALLKESEQAIHAIEQLFGSAEDPQVAKWQGLLELAKGNRNTAVKKLYAVYEQLKAASAQKELERIDSLLAYRLARIFEKTEELGAANEFFTVALRLANREAHDRIDESKPEVFLDYAEVLLKLKVYSEALHLINFFESQYWSNNRSKLLRIRAYIGAKQFDDAAEELASRPDASSNETIKLSLELVQAKVRQTQLAMAQKQLQERPGVVVIPVEPTGEKIAAAPESSVEIMKEEMKNYRGLEAGLMKKLLTVEPNSVEPIAVIAVCRYYIEQGYKAAAEDLANRFLARFPDNTAVLIYKKVMEEPNPVNISEQRRKEIEEQVISSVADPIRRAVELGVFYRRNNDLQKAAEQLKAALDLASSQGRSSDKAALERIDVAVRNVFDVAILMKDWQLAEQITEKARRENLDDCEGNLFAARLAAAKGQSKDALAKVDECLKQKPIFSRAYMLRSSINAELGDEDAAVEDARKAATQNPLDGAIARGLAVALYKRDQKLSKEGASYQVAETKNALDRAVVLNPGDLQLLGFYADYISSGEPLRALAIRQDIERVAPSLQNALRLGQLATKLAVEQKDPKRKEALFSVAESSYEEARKFDPQDKQMLYYYAEHFRARGMDDKAKKLLDESQDERLLWDHYFQRGQYDDAKVVLEQLYKSNPKDISVLKGLLLVAEKTSDVESAKKYSEELVALDGSIENHLIQVQTFLRVGLIKEADLKLQSFKEKHPDEPRAHLLDALLAMRQGQLQRALDLTNKNLQSNQNSVLAWRLRGEINFYLANYEQAINDLVRAKSLSEDPLTRTSLAKAYMQMGRFDDAITELKNTINAPGAPAEARRMLEYMYFQLGRKDALKTFYEETLAKFPDSPLWLNRAAAFAVAVGDLKTAEQLYEKAYRVRRELHRTPAPDDIQDVQYATAFDGYLRTLVLSAGDPNTGYWNPRKLDKVFEETKPHIDGALAPLAYVRMAEAKLRLGDKTVAREYCQKAVDKAGSNESLASEVLLRMYLLLGPDEVTKYCEQKLKSDPRSLVANFVMFNLARISGQYDKAVEYIDKCVELSGQDDQRKLDYITKKAEVLTLAYDKTSDNNYLLKAIADYESLLAKMPNNTNVLNNLAYMLAENNERLPEALGYAKRAFDASPNDPSFMDTYGYLLFKNGKTLEAAELLAAALQQYEQQGESTVPPEMLEHLGMVKEKLGAKAEAMSYYKRALETGAGRLSQKRKAQIDKAIGRLSQ